MKDLIDRYEIKISLAPEEDYFTARLPDFPGIITGGDTPEEALKNARDALQLTIETMQERKIPLPEPKTKYSGQFNVRIPRELHRTLVERAREEGVSLNAFINHIITQALILTKD